MNGVMIGPVGCHHKLSNDQGSYILLLQALVYLKVWLRGQSNGRHLAPRMACLLGVAEDGQYYDVLEFGAGTTCTALGEPFSAHILPSLATHLCEPADTAAARSRHFRDRIVARNAPTRFLE